ncbi:OsmC family protein [Neolewinella aurantiaca]|uniref:OsmC family protein n=1 Tax=Neolewinella aurantiaca TaxID=2602767 RepID=A0A5C7FXL3_9BACT|nr:OsmC family protein [Neolewinella aurantiaca]TXF90259.1 OsmC family protein [Neolewinella aurantiaca]
MSVVEYHVSGSIDPNREATYSVKKSSMTFGILSDQEDLPNPAELLLGAFAACCLKNVQRFSTLLGYDYTAAKIEVKGERQEKPTKMIAIRYIIRIESVDEKLNLKLLHRNLRKFGTIYNTLKEVCDVSGELIVSP